MGKVLTGSDVLAVRGFSDLAGMRVAFVGNHTSRLADRTPTHLALHAAQGVILAKLFSPEHGAFGKEDREDIGDDLDPTTGLPIFSLYGASRKPTPEMLAGLDALVFELQDIGARFYTYASTMLLCLEACREAGIRFIVLDRPNPITGTHFEGPLPDLDKLSFVCCYPMPIRHGLTLGELARLAAAEGTPLSNEGQNVSFRSPSDSQGEPPSHDGKPPFSTEGWNASLRSPSDSQGEPPSHDGKRPFSTEDWNASLRSPSDSQGEPPSHDGKERLTAAVSRPSGTVLTVIPCDGWRRGMWWDETGLSWVNPSPAMNSLEAAIVYPGVCLLEQTNVSVGRGTEAPFLIAGAPWIDAHAWAEAITAESGPGIEVSPYDFTPSLSKFEGELCHGVRLTITDREALESVRLGFAMICGLRDLYGDRFEVEGVDKLLASEGVLGEIKKGISSSRIRDYWLGSQAVWNKQVQPCLLY